MADCGSDEETKPPCKYGEKCYRKNPDHLRQFTHPTKNKPDKKNSKVTGSKRRSEEGQDDGDSKQPKLQQHSANPEDRPSSSDADSQQASEDEEDAPASPGNVKDNIRQKFLVDMPDDFFSFWDFCKSVDATKPQDSLSSLGLRLVGPYDVLSGTLKKKSIRKPSSFLTHCRYYYDPPEFQTVLAGDDPKTQFHVGYFRDDPEQLPVFVAGNSASIDCKICPMGENIFAAVDFLLQKKLSDERKTLKEKEVKNLEQLKDALHKWAKTGGHSLERETRNMKARQRKVVANCFHGAGIVVPYDKKTQVGYRPLGESDASLRNTLQKIVSCKTDALRSKQFESLQSIITRVQFANDECDPGMGLELALDLFCFGDPQFYSTVRSLLPLAYELLQRPQFARIAEAHMANRSKTLLELPNK